MIKRNAAGLFALLLFAACQSTPSNLFKEPSVSLNAVSLAGITFDSVDMVALVNVKNANRFTIPFPEINWNLFVADESFTTGIIKNNRKLEANSITAVEIPFSVAYKQLYSVITTLVDADEAPYRIEVGARFAIPVLGDKQFFTDFSGAIPMLKTPKISFDGIRFNSLALTKVEFVLTWLVENKNVFPITLDKLRYDFAVNNAFWTKGQTPSALNLQPRKTVKIPITVNVNSLTMIKDIVALASSGRNASFKCTGEASLRPAFEGVQPLSLPFSSTGSMNFGR
jgi:LEA14-like dessication related protein